MCPGCNVVQNHISYNKHFEVFVFVYVEFDVSVMDRNLHRCVREQGVEPARGLAERGTCRDSTGTWTRPSVGRPPETDSAGGQTESITSALT